MHHLSSFLLLATLFLSCSPKTPPTVQPELPLPPAPVFQVTIPFEQIEKDYAATTPQPLDDAARAKALALGERFSSSATAAYTTFIARLQEPSAPTFDNTVGALDDFRNSLLLGAYELDFLQSVHPDNYLREAAILYRQEAEKYLIALDMNQALYRRMASLAPQREGLNEDQRNLYDDLMLDYSLAGLDRPAEVLDRIRSLKEELSLLQTEFAQNLAKHQDPTLVTAAELTGMDQKFLNQLERRGDMYVIEAITAQVGPLLKHCSNEDLRKTILTKFRNRAAEKNKPLLKQVLHKRQELAKLLGYANHAEVRLIPRMAKTPGRVLEFLEGMHAAFLPRGQEELASLRQLKRDALKDPSVDLFPWDHEFYSNVMREQHFHIDLAKFSEYFPLQAVLENGLFGVYQTLFSVTFREVQRLSYHPDVRTFEVFDGEQKIGTFLLDLFPRPNKYTHAAEFSLKGHKVFSDGTVQLPEAAIVCNFTKPTPSEPSLLTPYEIETLFHEFGHLMHELLSETRYFQQSGTSVKHDFVETPSQLLERWPRDRAIVSRFARHYQTNKPLPEEYLVYMEEEPRFLPGLATLAQLFYATYDLRLHLGEPPADTSAMWRDLSAEFPGAIYVEGTSPEAGFGHLMEYDAGYYAYLWAEVLAADLFAAMRAQGLLDPVAGQRLRALLFAPGGSVDPNTLMLELLGREPDKKAFLAERGL